MHYGQPPATQVVDTRFSRGLAHACMLSSVLWAAIFWAVMALR